MFTSHMPPINQIPRQYFYLGAGVALIVGLLVGMAVVASGEVKKAQARDLVLASQKNAMTYCVENLRGSAFNACMQKARADSFNDGSRNTLATGGNAKGDAILAGGTAPVSAGSQGLMPISFSAVR